MKCKWILGILMFLCAGFASAQNPPIVQVVGNSAIATTETVNVATTGSGHVFVVLVCGQISQGPQTPVDNAPGGSSVYTPISGSYQVGPAGTAGTNYFCEYYIANPGKAGVTQVTLNSTASDEAQMWFYELTGLAANPADQAGGNSGLTSTAALVGPALTTKSANELVLQVAYLFDGLYGVNPPWTQDVDVTEGGNVDTAHLITSSIGTYAANFVVPPDGRASWTSGISLKLASAVSLAPVVQRSGWNANCTASSSCTTTISPAKAGDLIAVTVSLTGSSASAIGTVSVLDSASQTYTQIGSPLFQTAANNAAETWYFNSTAAGVSSVTVSRTAGTGIMMDVVELSGVATGNPVDAQAGAVSSSAVTSFSSGNITTTTANDILFAFETNDSTPIPFGGPGPATQSPSYVALDEYANYGTAYQVAGAAGSYSASFVSDVRSNTCYTCSGSETVQPYDWTTKIVAFKPFVSGASLSISGTITSGAGATVALSGASTASTTADSSGKYTFSGLASGKYTVTPSSSVLTFSPTTQSVTLTGTSVTGVNFIATTDPTISGAITGGSGVTVTLSGASSASTTADSSGNYSFPAPTNGNYTVTPSASGMTFAPVSQTITVNNTSVAGVNFTATLVTYSISGIITPAATASGSLVTLSGTANQTVTVDASGNYRFDNLLSGAYTITPSLAGLIFNPASSSVTINNSSVTGVNFTAQQSAISLDATVSKDQGPASTTVAVTGLTTNSANELVLAFVASDATSTGTNTTVAGIAGGSLTWTLVGRTNTQRGTSEIWRAFASAALSNVGVTATLSQSAASSMTVMSFTGVNTSGTGGSGAIGATGTGNANPGAPTATLTTTQANSWVLGVGNDWDSAISRTPGTNQTVVHQYLSTSGDTYWVQRVTTLVAAGTSVKVNDTAPSTDRYNLTTVEILPATPGSNPGVGLSSTSLNFGSQQIVTTSAAQDVTLTNTGTAALSVASIVAAGDYGQTNDCGSSVPVSGSCTISVVFSPTAVGTRTGTITITDNAPASPQVISLTGTGTNSGVSLSSSSLTFPNEPVNTTSPSQAVTLFNTGNGALSITSIGITGTNPGDFAQTNTCGASVASGGNCVITVTFTPTTAGTRTATVSVVDSGAGSPHTISLTGTGNGAAVTLSPTGLTFASQALGTTSASQGVTVTNTGTQTLSITSIALGGANSTDFAQTNTCGTSLAAGGSCTVTVTFKPTATGTRAASVTLTDGAVGSPQTITLSGTGSGAVVSLSGSSLTFTAVPFGTSSASQPVTLTNTGNQPLTITSIAVTGTNGADFAQTNNCVSPIAAAASCIINVTFTPSAPGTRTASVTITDGALGSPHTVALTGTGAGPFVALSSTALTFTPQLLNTASAAQTVTLSNTGTQPLSIASIVLGGTNGADFANTSTCGASVAAGANCSVGVTFTPTATGARAATITITDGAASSPHVITLAGTGTTTFSISGAISPAATGSGATVNLTGAATATTTADVNGLYTFSGLANGAYTVTPVKTGTTFAPASQPVTINNAVATGVNFTATATPIAIDATVSKDQGTASTTIAATALTTKATNELLLAFVATDGPSTGANTTVTGIAGGGLTWALVVRTNTQLGSSEIWRAFATTTLSSVTVTATLSQKMTSSMTVMSFTGANATGTAGSGAIGATGTANANPGAPSASLITTQANSMVLGVGNDWDNATSRTAGASQTVVHQYLSPNGDTYWVQRVTTSAAAGTTVTINDTAPATDRYNLSIVEIHQ